MNMTDVKTKAKDLGLKVGKLRKAELIRAIQDKEGNFPCFETAKEYCSEKACCWRNACMPEKKTLKGWEKKKKEYTKKITAEHKKLKKQLTDLEKKAKIMVGKGKKEVLADIGILEKKRATLTQKSKKMASASEDAWEIAKKGIDDAWDDLSKAFKKAAKKFN